MLTDRELLEFLNKRCGFYVSKTALRACRWVGALESVKFSTNYLTRQQDAEALAEKLIAGKNKWGR